MRFDDLPENGRGKMRNRSPIAGYIAGDLLLARGIAHVNRLSSVPTCYAARRDDQRERNLRVRLVNVHQQQARLLAERKA